MWKWPGKLQVCFKFFFYTLACYFFHSFYYILKEVKFLSICFKLVNVEEERRERSRKAKERRKEKRRSSPSDDPKPELDEPESVLRLILDRYPDVASDLRKVLAVLLSLIVKPRL